MEKPVQEIARAFCFSESQTRKTGYQILNKEIFYYEFH